MRVRLASVTRRFLGISTRFVAGVWRERNDLHHSIPEHGRIPQYQRQRPPFLFASSAEAMTYECSESFPALPSAKRLSMVL